MSRRSWISERRLGVLLPLRAGERIWGSGGREIRGEDPRPATWVEEFVPVGLGLGGGNANRNVVEMVFRQSREWG